MVQKNEAIEAINLVLRSRESVRIRIGSEEFSTKIIHLDKNTNTFYSDIVIPKYGDNLLEAEKVYQFRQDWYNTGTINLLEFLSVYRKQGELNGLPAHLFNLPHEITRKSTLFDVGPRKGENVALTFKYKGRVFELRPERLNVQNIYFRLTNDEIDIPDRLIVADSILRLPQYEVTLKGIIRRDSKYDHHLEIENIAIDQRLRLIRYIDYTYRAMMGFEKMNIEGQSASLSPRRVLQRETSAKSRIFIIDSDLLVTDMVSRALTGRGFECFVYHDGAGVVEIAAKQKPNVIILAISLDKYDGLTILRRLQRNPDTEDIPVVMLTYSADKEDVLDASHAGAAMYLIKSPDMDLKVFADKIESILRADGFV